MGKDRPTAGSRRWPLGLLGMLAIVVAVESAIGRHALDFTETSALSWALSDAAARDQARAADVLVFGDSLAKHGVLPKPLGEGLGRPAYNLAVCAATAPTQYYLLRHALDAGARPTAIVVDFMPGLLAADPEHSRRFWPELLSFAEILDLSRRARDVSLLVDGWLDRLLPSRRSYWEIRGRVASAWLGKVDILRETNLMQRRNWRINLGAQFTQDNHAWTGQPTEADHVRHLSDRFWCHRINREYVARFLDLAAANRIGVYWLLPPASPEIQRRRNDSGADAKYTRFVREVVAGRSGVVVLDARRSGYGHAKFVDPIHMTGKGALALTAEVAAAIASGRSGWLDLPAGPDDPPRGPYEDVEQSRLLVRAAERGVRR